MAELLTYTCPCCGGSLKFDTRSQNVKCEFCETEFTADDLKSYDDTLIKGKEEDDKNWTVEDTGEFSESDGLNVYLCKTCGGEVVGDENTASTLCPYCGNAVFFSERLSGGLKPKYVIPFKLTAENAKENLNNFFKGKVLLPGSFIRDNEVKEVTSLYVPYWLFDADVNGNITYRATKVRHYRSGNYNCTETKTYKIIRNGRIAFEHIPVDASTKMDDKMMESIEPFDFSEAKPFSQAYIAGYSADKYDVAEKDNFVRADVRIKEGTADEFRKTVKGYDTVRTETSRVSYNSNSASYALYPVWTLNSTYKDKNYQFAMNAQTGRLVGNLPMSKLKYFLWFLGTSLLTFGILFSMFYFGFMKNEEDRLGNSLIIGIIFGLFVALIVTQILKKQLKPVKFQHGAKQYIVPGSMQLTFARDIYLSTHVTRVKIQTNNNRK